MHKIYIFANKQMICYIMYHENNIKKLKMYRNTYVEINLKNIVVNI